MVLPVLLPALLPAVLVELCLASSAGQDPRGGPEALEWTSPGLDGAGSSPIGNGRLGANVWVDAAGSVHVLLARDDTFSEACRLLKVGAVALEFDPPLDVSDGSRETLDPARGEWRLTCAGGELVLFVEPERDVLRAFGSFEEPRRVTVRNTGWRRADRRLSGGELVSSWTMRDAPESVAVVESGDIALQLDGAIGWYHCNTSSIVPLTVAHQGLDSIATIVGDPLLSRTFGAVAHGRGFTALDAHTLRSDEARSRFDIALAAPAARQPSASADTQTRAAFPHAWLADAHALAATDVTFEAARETNRAHWAAFWSRSWIVIDGDAVANDGQEAGAAPSSPITRGYALQRYMTACAGRGAFPIKFNGSIFTVEPSAAGQPAYDADWRRWGDCYWWQNTRLPYHAMLAAGDFELMEPLFDFHASIAPTCRARVDLYHGAAGLYFPETVNMFGCYSNGDYGWQREGRAANEVLCPWWQWAWNQGPELVALMLDRNDFAPDLAFARDELVPIARDVLAYFDTRFERDADGRLVITPTQALETHWHGVVNDLPCVAGLTDVLERLARLPDGAATPADRELWRRLAAALPALPVHGEGDDERLAPAEVFDASRQNVETPELHALFPHRRIALGSPNIELAARAYTHRHDRQDRGWTQDGIWAARLGLVDDARAQLVARAANSHPGYRFPATWGPNFDWLPDQCHGANLMLLAQEMLVQSVGERILLFPAWPREWDVDFKLHAAHGTVVHARLEDGELTLLDVEPAERRADVEVLLR